MIKLELVGDDYTLQPDTLNLPAVAETLIKEGFKVLPYCTEDWYCAAACSTSAAALMPWPHPSAPAKARSTRMRCACCASACPIRR